jgi:hypothetical protein
MLNAKEGRIINTSMNTSFISISVTVESGLLGPEAVSTTSIPNMPKSIDA